MGRSRKVVTDDYYDDNNYCQRPGETDEAEENRLIGLATQLAEKQLREGTASSQVITHYLKLGSTKDRLEKEILVSQKELMNAKREALQSQRRSEEMIQEAMEAFKSYSGHTDESEYE